MESHSEMPKESPLSVVATRRFFNPSLENLEILKTKIYDLQGV